MINFSFRIANPFKHTSFQSIWQQDISITKNKTLELGFYRYAWDLFELSIDLRWWGHDHAGPSFEINIFGYAFRLGVCDTRHWDHEKDDWCSHD